MNEMEDEVIPSVQAILSDQSVLSGSSDQTIPYVQINQGFGTGLLNTNGTGKVTVDLFKDSEDDNLHTEYDMDPKTNTVAPVYGDPFNTYIGSVEVLVNGVRIPRSLYYIEPLVMRLHFKNLAITGPSRVQLKSQREYSPYETMDGVLILPSSKEIPFGRLHEFAPVLFEKISADHILKYKSNERFVDKIIEARKKPFMLNEVYVMSYKILPRGIYASIKYYTD